MKQKTAKILSLSLAAMLQSLPLVRTVLPALQAEAPPMWADIIRWAAGGVAFFGYHAISSASSIAISPPAATYGTPYTGTITYSGGHAGSVSSMSMSNNCLGSWTLAPGLTVTYGGGNVANVSGTPVGSVSNTVPFTLKMFDGSGCGGGNSDTRATAITLIPAPSGNSQPNITVIPQSIVSQVGVDALLSGGAIGSPPPQYYWTQGAAVIPGATNNYLLVSNVQLTNAGIYQLHATNSGGADVKACYLTVALTPGSNVLALNYTNFYPAGNPLTIYSSITNVSVATNTYDWQYNFVSTGITTSNFNLAVGSVIPFKNGNYAVSFTSVVPTNSLIGTNTTIAKAQQYYSYWQFGYAPAISNQPAPTSVSSGATATFTAAVRGSLNVLIYPTALGPVYSTNASTPCAFWYLNGTNLVASQVYSLAPTNTASYSTNVASVSLSIPGATAANAGNYTVVITNFWGSITSAPAALTISGATLSVTTPAGTTNYAGKNVSLGVTASGTAPLSYQWLKGGATLPASGTITGVNTNALNLAPAATSDSGNYSVIVTNSSGSVTSGVALVSIVAVPGVAASAAANGSLTLSGNGGVAGANYVVLTSTNLSGSSGWTPIQTNPVPGNGAISFTDTNTAAYPQRFYKVQF